MTRSSKRITASAAQAGWSRLFVLALSAPLIEKEGMG
jgi:hypothetical protein